MGNVMLVLACHCKSANGLLNVLFVSKAFLTSYYVVNSSAISLFSVTFAYGFGLRKAEKPVLRELVNRYSGSSKAGSALRHPNVR